MASQFVLALVVLMLVTAPVLAGSGAPQAVEHSSVISGLVGNTADVSLDPSARPALTTSPTPIDACRVIDAPGTYVLTRDIVSDPASTPSGFVCLLVTVDDPNHEVVIDGDGFALRSADRTDTAISVGSDGTTVVTDLELSGWDQAVEAADPQRSRPGRVDGVELTQVVVRDNRIGVNVDSARFLSIRDSDVSGNGLGIGTAETTIAFTRLTVSDNERSGLAAAQTDGTVSDSEFSGNGGDGLQFAISGPVEVRRVTASDNGGAGVSVAETSGLTLADSDLSGNAEAGVTLVGVSDADVVSNRLADNTVGIQLRDSLSDVVVSKNRVENSADAGVVVSRAVGGQVFDNVLSNDVNVREADRPPFAGPPSVSWDVTPRVGLNVVDGAFVGGNYYATPAGDGFSETCVDADVDTLCDDSLELFEGNVDEYPLAEPRVPADEPPLAVAPVDLRGHTFALTCSGLATLPTVRFSYGVLARLGVPPDAARFTVSNEDILAAAANSPLGPAVRRLGLGPDDLLWAANPDESVVRVFVTTWFGVNTCTIRIHP